MAYKVAEAWINSANTIIAVKTQKGYHYFVTATDFNINGHSLSSAPVVAAEISGLNLEIMEAKQNA